MIKKLIRIYKDWQLLRQVKKWVKLERENVSYGPAEDVEAMDNHLKKEYGLRKRSESQFYKDNFIKPL